LDGLIFPECQNVFDNNQKYYFHEKMNEILYLTKRLTKKNFYLAPENNYRLKRTMKGSSRFFFKGANILFQNLRKKR
jgi:hypothetical protein